MLTASPPVPGPGFVATTAVMTWLEPTSAGPVAWLLIGHCGPRRPGETPQSIEAGLSSMADALCLSPVAERVLAIGNRLILRGRVTALDYGHPDYLLRVPSPGERWREHVARGGNALVVIGLDPIPPAAAQDAIDAYLRHVATTDRARLGATGVRGQGRWDIAHTPPGCPRHHCGHPALSQNSQYRRRPEALGPAITSVIAKPSAFESSSLRVSGESRPTC